MLQVAEHLSTLLGREVPLVKDWIDGVEVGAGEAVTLTYQYSVLIRH